MLEPPDLPNDRVVASVRRLYGLYLTTLAFLPQGQDVRAWAYRATTAESAPWFLKLRRGNVNEAVLRVPRYLADHGVPHVVAPFPTRDHRLWIAVEDFTLTLYPFIAGQTGGARGLQARHWRTYGAALRALHDTPVESDLARLVHWEAFTSPWPALLHAVEAALGQQEEPDPCGRELAAWWPGRRAEIWALAERLQALGHRLQLQPPPRVLCHADLHLNNILIDADDGLWMVDWDDTLLAPKECDLMMGIRGLSRATVGPREEAWFREGYGRTDIDPVALAYYRHLRAVGDIAALGEQVVLLPEVGEATKRRALDWLERLFAPGYIVALAGQLERFAR